MDDTTTNAVDGPDDADQEGRSLTRREAVGAAAAGVTVLALGAETAGAVTTASVSQLTRSVSINAPRDVVFDLDAVQRIQKNILGQLGCQACCSGWDIRFPDEVQFVVGKGGKLRRLSSTVVRARMGVNR